MPSPTITSASGILNRNADDISFIRINGTNLSASDVIVMYDSPPRTLWSGSAVEAATGGTWAIFQVQAQPLFFALVCGELIVPAVSAAAAVSVTITDTVTGGSGHGTVTTDVIDVDIVS
ncbi:MAG: hypothetical protein U0871_21425 [Gemmataceae bacterium]